MSRFTGQIFTKFYANDRTMIAYDSSKLRFPIAQKTLPW